MGQFLKKLARSLHARATVRPAQRSERRATLHVEGLENRELMSITPIVIHVPLHPQPLDPIQVKYQSLGGPSGILGKPISSEQGTPYGGGLYEKFQHGAIFYSAQTGAHDVDLATEKEFFATGKETDAYGTVVEKLLGLPNQDETNAYHLFNVKVTEFQGGAIYSSPSAGTHVVYGAIGAEYAATALETDAYGFHVQTILGAPTSDEMNVPGVPGARMNTFQGGAIYWSPSTGAHVVYGAIGSKYASLGGPAGYGLPMSDEANVRGVPGVRVTYFQGGRALYWSGATGAHAVYGAIGAEYTATAGETDAYGTDVQSILGAPTSDEMNVPGVPGARMNTFQGGAIYYWSPSTGAHVVYGGIGSKYDSLGGPAGYGLPTSDEANVPGVPGVRVTFFDGGRALYWSAATGAHAVYGAVGAEYTATAGERDFYNYDVQTLLGAPTSDERNVPGVPGARMNTFQGGTIYWSPSTGAHVVYGAIGGLYQNLGGPTSYLGMPTTDELAMTGGRVQYFEHGKMWWTPSSGAHAVQSVSQMTFNWNNINLGDVQGWAQLTIYADGAYNFVGHFHDGGAWDYDDSITFGVMSPSGVLYTFTHTGSVGGWLDPFESSNDNWDVSGTSPALAAGWTDLQGASWHAQAQTSWDVSGLLNEIQKALGVASAIIAIV